MFCKSILRFSGLPLGRPLECFLGWLVGRGRSLLALLLGGSAVLFCKIVQEIIASALLPLLDHGCKRRHV